MTNQQQLTRLLQRWQEGDEDAFEQFLEHTYQTLRDLAGSLLKKEFKPRTITPTELLHESLFKLFDLQSMDWHSREQFYRLAVTIMKHLLIDQARRRKAARHGGDQVLVTLEGEGDEGEPNLPIERLTHALDAYKLIDPKGALIVELKFFVGLRVEEIAAHLDVAPITVHRSWKASRAWLHARCLGYQT